ncbi:MAG TPA: hypothetical protein VM511_08040 [Luteolibacter sp.]|nr:hypothetical protein [Luteolibacter sp.]
MKPILLIAAAILPTQAAVLYSETFTHAGGGVEVATSTVGWTSYYTATAQAIPNPASTPRMAIGNQVGVDASPGYLFSQGNGTSQTYVAFEATSFSILPTDIANITFRQGNSDAALASRLIIQQGGNWYATSSTFGTAAMDLPTFQTSGGESESFTFSLTAASWRSLTIIPGTSLALGAVIGSDLSSSTPITSIGFLTTSQNAVTRIDNLAINSIPEASSLLLCGIAAFGITGRRRRN